MLTLYQDAGLSIYVRFSDGTAVDLTAGSGLDGRMYTASDAAIQAAGLGAGTYSGVALVGSAASQSALDPMASEAFEFIWSGTAEVEPVVHADVKKINDVTIVGSGVLGDEFDV